MWSLAHIAHWATEGKLIWKDGDQVKAGDQRHRDRPVSAAGIYCMSTARAQAHPEKQGPISSALVIDYSIQYSSELVLNMGVFVHQS